MYLLIFPDVFFTKGAKRTLVLDFKREELLYIPNLPCGLQEQFSTETIECIFSKWGEEWHEFIQQFIEFILRYGLGVLVEDITGFRKIEEIYCSPCLIEIACIDIEKHTHRYDYIAAQLAKLNCQHLQFRYFLPVSLAEVDKTLQPFLQHEWLSIELIICQPNWNHVDEAISFLEKYPMLSMIVFNQEKNYYKKIETEFTSQSIGFILYSEQSFSSPRDCGVINRRTLYRLKTVHSYMFNKLYNSCLYKKLFISSEGDVMNCPCIPRYYGNIDQNDVLLIDIVSDEKFQSLGMINKDRISVCKLCEFRYLCNDCRAFLENLMDKPYKCHYNPESMQWDEEIRSES